MDEPRGLTISPFCARLASKKLCFRTAPPRVEEDVLDGSAHVWCTRTMLALGPDGRIVDTSLCRRGRACYEGYAALSAPDA
jgi:hypothetical protein